MLSIVGKFGKLIAAEFTGRDADLRGANAQTGGSDPATRSWRPLPHVEFQVCSADGDDIEIETALATARIGAD